VNVRSRFVSVVVVYDVGLELSTWCGTESDQRREAAEER